MISDSIPFIRIKIFIKIHKMYIILYKTAHILIDTYIYMYVYKCFIDNVYTLIEYVYCIFYLVNYGYT
jgi:hypothetical protein